MWSRRGVAFLFLQKGRPAAARAPPRRTTRGPRPRSLEPGLSEKRKSMATFPLARLGGGGARRALVGCRARAERAGEDRWDAAGGTLPFWGWCCRRCPLSGCRLLEGWGAAAAARGAGRSHVRVPQAANKRLVNGFSGTRGVSWRKSLGLAADIGRICQLTRVLTHGEEGSLIAKRRAAALKPSKPQRGRKKWTASIQASRASG